MNSLQAIRGRYLEEGVDYLNASAKTCQDIVLQMISASSLKQHVTLKGGVVMQHLSKDIRRATQDIDFDFIRYSLRDDMIRNFIQRLNVDCSRLQAIMQVCIFDDDSMRENNQQEVTWRLEQVLNSKRFLSQVKLSRKDWLELPVEDVATALLHFFAQLHG